MLAGVTYDQVEDSHIVPAGYLRGFAEGNMIMRHKVATNRVYERSVRKVGTRKRAYARHRPKDGSRIDDVEWALSQLENHIESVRKADQRFPFSREDRSVIAEFAASQHVRGPKWAQQNKENHEALMTEIETSGLLPSDPIINEITKPGIKRNEAQLGTDTALLATMQRWIYVTKTVFYAMHWTLVRFERPILITSDHPVVLWPATEEPRSSTANASVGLLNTLEVRYPLTSQLCLLMTWRDEPDAPEIVPGNREKAKNVNGFTRAQAEDEWFYLPGTTPPMPDEHSRLLPLSMLLYPHYGIGQVASSRRRDAAATAAHQVQREPLKKNPTFIGIDIRQDSRTDSARPSLDAATTFRYRAFCHAWHTSQALPGNGPCRRLCHPAPPKQPVSTGNQPDLGCGLKRRSNGSCKR
jgi:hypothetical protein